MKMKNKTNPLILDNLVSMPNIKDLQVTD